MYLYVKYENAYRRVFAMNEHNSLCSVIPLWYEYPILMIFFYWNRKTITVNQPLFVSDPQNQRAFVIK